MHGRERRVHYYCGPVRRVESRRAFLGGHPPHAVCHPLVGAPLELEPLLHHVHRRYYSVARHRRPDTRRRVSRRRVISASAVQEELLEELIDGEVDGVGRACAEAHGPYAPVESGGALRPEEGGEGVADGGSLAGFEGGLHSGLEGVDGEHGHVLDGSGEGTGHHELPEAEAIVGRGGLQLDLVGHGSENQLRFKSCRENQKLVTEVGNRISSNKKKKI
ncbi:hypothetical protein V2J09_018577 [Rumex salicifolius]